jgi:hypothetical protein
MKEISRRIGRVFGRGAVVTKVQPEVSSAVEPTKLTVIESSGGRTVALSNVNADYRAMHSFEPPFAKSCFGRVGTWRPAKLGGNSKRRKVK